MNATRHARSSTNETLTVLTELIRGGKADVRLFATHRDEVGGFDVGSDGPVSNLPLVAALVHDGVRWIAFDGNLLTAARLPRSMEVHDLLNIAVEQGTVRFGKYPVDFTSKMHPVEAATYLSSLETAPLSAGSRIDYAGLLTLVDVNKL